MKLLNYMPTVNVDVWGTWRQNTSIVTHSTRK